MHCWPGSLKAKADQGVNLQQSGRNLSCTFGILSVISSLDLVPSWEVILAALLTWSHSIPHLHISRSFSIGCLYTLIFLLCVFLNPINPQSNSSCQETRSGVALGVWGWKLHEYGDENLDVPWGGLGGSCEHIQSIPSRSAQDSLEDVCTWIPHP